MKNIFKQFVAWATPSFQSEYKRAVLKITLYNFLGVFVVLLIFNLMVYGLFAQSLDLLEHENGENKIALFEKEELAEDQVIEIENNLVNILLISDLIILIITIFVAYLTSKKTLAPLEESYKKQTRFVADAAHELRTPLSVMKAGFEVTLRKYRTEDNYIKIISDSLDEVKRLTTLSNDLLLLVHDKKRIILNEINFSDICKNQIEGMTSYAQTKNISINETIDEDLYILGSKDDLIRLVINLLKNAIDYNKNEGMVAISLTQVHHNIILSVKDTGIGIENSDLPHIFERFYKADLSRTENSSGSGLGLSIVEEIVAEHSGSIKVESKIGVGTTFTVTFPSV